MPGTIDICVKVKGAKFAAHAGEIISASAKFPGMDNRTNNLVYLHVDDIPHTYATDAQAISVLRQSLGRYLLNPDYDEDNPDEAEEQLRCLYMFPVTSLTEEELTGAQSESRTVVVSASRFIEAIRKREAVGADKNNPLLDTLVTVEWGDLF